MKLSTALLSMLCVALFCGLCRADGPATAPSLSPDQEAILKTFRDYNDAMARGETATMISLQHAVSDNQKKYSAAVAGGDTAIGKLRAAVESKMNADAAARVAKAAGDIGNDDLKTATVRVVEDKGSVVVQGGSIAMIRIDGNWKFDLAGPQLDADPERFSQLMARQEKRNKRMALVTAAVEEGKLKSAEEVIAELSNEDL